MLWSILAAIFVGLLWAVTWVLELPLWIAIVPTLLLVVLFAGFFVWRRMQAHKAAKEIERALHAQADAHVKNVRPDLQPEIQEMQSEFSKAVSALKASKLARGGQDSLSVLPWYMIIGPPGSGKSTALRNSGLQFPYLSSRGGGVKGVGGTRNCEWWLTNEAVILDTAGRYTTEDDDRDEWFSFLDTLTRTRSRKPVNGLIVAVAVSDLATGDEEAASELGSKIRDRVDEVMARLKLIVPVYLLFTKCDLISGFTEIFGPLHKAERGQIWGFTVPVAQKVSQPGDLFRERFDELTEVLGGHALHRITQERRLESREKVFQFPQQFEALKANLGEFVQTLFAENVYQDTPVMRGVYFTSGTQEGRPIDRVMKAMAEAFGIRRSLPAALEPAGEAKSYFLRDVFSKVMFPDQNIAVRSTSESRRQINLQYLYAGGSLVLALIILLFPTMSFFKNRALVQSTREEVEAVRGKLDSATPTAAALQALAPLRAKMDTLYQYDVEGPPTSMRFGMYPGGALFQAVRSFYAGAVAQRLFAPLLLQDQEEMEAFARKLEGSDAPPSEAEHLKHYGKLKLHLLLTAPPAEGGPQLGEAEQEWATRIITERWRRRPGINGNAELLKELEGHARTYLKLVSSDASLLGARNEAVVRRTRVILNRLPFAQVALEQVLSAPELEDYEVSLGSMLGGSLSQLRSDTRVRGAFTRKGFEAVVSQKLSGELGGEETWVLGRKLGGSGDAESSERIKQVRSQYFQRYIQAWRDFVGGIRVSEPANSSEALAMLEDLTRGEPAPLGRFFRALAFNVRLDDGDTDAAVESLKEEVVDKLKKRLGAGGKRLASATEGALSDDDEDEDGEQLLTARDVERSFAGLLRFGAPASKKGKEDKDEAESLPLDVYQEQLVFLRDALRNDLENPDDHAPLLTRLQTARVRVSSLIDGQEIGWRPRLQALLWPPLEGSSKASTTEAAAGTSQQWCSAVVSAFDQSLSNRYPFHPNGHDAALADVADFYKPQTGTLWAFYKETLSQDMLREGSEFKFARRLGNVASTIYQPQILSFLSRANDVSSALFAPGSPELGIQFSIHVQPSPRVQSISLTVDGQTVEYKNGPEEWNNLKWPAQGKTLGAALKVRTNQGVTETLQQEGEWGLFRLMEAGKLLTSSGARVFTVVWKIDSLNVEVAIDFRPARTDTPFFGAVKPGQKLQLMRPFRAPHVVPPRAIGKGSPPCGRD